MAAEEFCTCDPHAVALSGMPWAGLRDNWINTDFRAERMWPVLAVRPFACSSGSMGNQLPVPFVNNRPSSAVACSLKGGRVALAALEFTDLGFDTVAGVQKEFRPSAPNPFHDASVFVCQARKR